MNDFNEAVQKRPDSELLKMVYEIDQWNPDMLYAVEKELSNRGLLPVDLAISKQKLVENEEIELSKGKDAGLMGQTIGWLTVFGLLGIAVGYTYAFSKVKSKYSENWYFKYNDHSRKNGTYLFYASLCLSGIAILYKFITLGGTSI